VTAERERARICCTVPKLSGAGHPGPVCGGRRAV